MQFLRPPIVQLILSLAISVTPFGDQRGYTTWWHTQSGLRPTPSLERLLVGSYVSLIRYWHQITDDCATESSMAVSQYSVAKWKKSPRVRWRDITSSSIRSNLVPNGSRTLFRVQRTSIQEKRSVLHPGLVNLVGSTDRVAARVCKV